MKNTNPSFAGPTRRQRRRLISLRRFNKNDEGAAAIEFAIVAPVFFMMLFGILETAWMYTTNRILSVAVDQVARQIKTGQIRGNISAADFQNSLCNAGSMRILDCGRLVVDVQNMTDFAPRGNDFDSEGNLNTTNFGFQPGGRQTINVVRAYYMYDPFINWTAFGVDAWIDGKSALGATAAFRTEPF